MCIQYKQFIQYGVPHSEFWGLCNYFAILQDCKNNGRKKFANTIIKREEPKTI